MICYFSATGNSRHVANRLAQSLNEPVISVLDVLGKPVFVEDIYLVTVKSRILQNGGQAAAQKLCEIVVDGKQKIHDTPRTCCANRLPASRSARSGCPTACSH